MRTGWSDLEGGEGGRFAVFESMQHGVAALYKQLQLYFKRGINTLSSIVKTYAPASDKTTSTPIFLRSPKRQEKVLTRFWIQVTQHNCKVNEGIVDHENGKGYISSSDIMGVFSWVQAHLLQEICQRLPEARPTSISAKSTCRHRQVMPMLSVLISRETFRETAW
jgi:hypothetical protein